MANELMLKDPKKVLVQQVETLRQYAAKTVVLGEVLGLEEEANLAALMSQFFVLAKGFPLTPKETVVMILREPSMIEDRNGCGCHSCASRAGV